MYYVSDYVSDYVSVCAEYSTPIFGLSRPNLLFCLIF